MAKASWVKIANIEMHHDLQPRVERPAGAVEEYAELLRSSEDKWPFHQPVVLYEVGGAKFLTSGWTRVESAKEVGLKSVYAETRKGQWLDAVAHACGANADHGYRRTVKDKRRAVEILLRHVSDEQESWSDTRIAQDCRVSAPFVASVRSVLEKSGSVTPSEVRVDKKGTKRAARKKVKPSKNGKAKAPEPPEPPEEQDQYAELGQCPVPKCGATDRWVLTDDGYECDSCGHPHGVEAGSSGDEEEYQEGYDIIATAKRVVSAKQLKKAKQSLGTLTRSTTAIGLEHELEHHLRAIHDHLSQCEPDE